MKKQLQEILGHIRRADNDFDFITDGDKIAVGLSGGKDSNLLLYALAQYQKFGHKRFDLIAITVDGTGGNTDFSGLQKYCDDLSVKLIIEPSEIFKIVFDIRREKNPCSLCSNLRRGILHSSAKRNGANKVALGHHSDDMIETFLMSMIHEGRINTFEPKTYLDRIDITIIRPMIYVPEHEIISITANPIFKRNVIKNPCPVNHHTQREYMKDLVKKLTKDHTMARDKMARAISKWLKSRDVVQP